MATDVGGVSELMKQSEQGYLAPPGDHQALAKAISKVLEQDWEPKTLAASVAGPQLAGQRGRAA